MVFPSISSIENDLCVGVESCTNKKDVVNRLCMKIASFLRHTQSFRNSARHIAAPFSYWNGMQIIWSNPSIRSMVVLTVRFSVLSQFGHWTYDYFGEILWTMLTAYCVTKNLLLLLLSPVIPQLFCRASGINSRILSVKSAVCVFPVLTIGTRCTILLQFSLH